MAASSLRVSLCAAVEELVSRVPPAEQGTFSSLLIFTCVVLVVLTPPIGQGQRSRAKSRGPGRRAHLPWSRALIRRRLTALNFIPMCAFTFAYWETYAQRGYNPGFCGQRMKFLCVRWLLNTRLYLQSNGKGVKTFCEGADFRPRCTFLPLEMIFTSRTVWLYCTVA